MTKEEAQWATKFLIDYEATKKHLFETEFLAPFAERAHCTPSALRRITDYIKQ